MFVNRDFCKNTGVFAKFTAIYTLSSAAYPENIPLIDACPGSLYYQPIVKPASKAPHLSAPEWNANV